MRTHFINARVIYPDRVEQGFVTVEGDKVPQTWIERRPDRRFLQINSKPLTVPHEVNSWYVAQVL